MNEGKASEFSLSDLEFLFHKARRILSKKIKKVKTDAWDELVKTIDDDLWGLPYGIVMDRLKRSSMALTESIEPRIAEALLDALFLAEVHDPMAA